MRRRQQIITRGSVRCADDPTWWDEHDAGLLDGSCAAPVLRGYRLALEKLAIWRERLFKLHVQLGGSVPAGRDAQWVLSAVALRWARSTVWSRAFNATLDGSKTVVLVPVSTAWAASCFPLPVVTWVQSNMGTVLQILDMLDHHPDSQAKWTVQDDQFQLTAHTRVQQVGYAHLIEVHQSCWSEYADSKDEWRIRRDRPCTSTTVTSQTRSYCLAMALYCLIMSLIS